MVYNVSYVQTYVVLMLAVVQWIGGPTVATQCLTTSCQAKKGNGPFASSRWESFGRKQSETVANHPLKKVF